MLVWGKIDASTIWYQTWVKVKMQHDVGQDACWDNMENYKKNKEFRFPLEKSEV